MQLTKDTPVSELYHSDDELMHWKYVKKEKRSNGKWRYYYDTEEVKSDLAKLDRYVEAADIWLKSRLHLTIKDVLTNTGARALTWQESKETVDYRYRGGDQNKLLTDKYRKDK